MLTLPVWNSEYFDSVGDDAPDFTGSSVTRTDAVIDFDTSIDSNPASTDPLWTRANWSARFTGDLVSDVDCVVRISVVKRDDGVSVHEGGGGELIHCSIDAPTTCHALVTVLAGVPRPIEIRYWNTIYPLAALKLSFVLDHEIITVPDCDPIEERAMSDELEAALSESSINHILLWKIKPAGKDALGRCSLDREVVFDDDTDDGPILYSGIGSASSTEVEVGVKMEVRSVEVKTFAAGTTLPLTGITRLRAITGYFNDAVVDIYLGVWAMDTDGSIILPFGAAQIWSGKLGKYDISDTMVTFELLDWSQIANRNTGRQATDRCPWVPVFGMSGFPCRCNMAGGAGDGPHIEDLTYEGTVASVVTQSHFTLSGITLADGKANLGKLLFVAPDEDFDGAEYAVKKWLADGNVWLTDSVPFTVEVGQAIKLKEGCVGTTEACKTHNNIKNFGAQPFSLGNKSFIRQESAVTP